MSLHSLITSVCNHNMGLYISNNNYDDNGNNNSSKNKKKHCWDKKTIITQQHANFEYQ